MGRTEAIPGASFLKETGTGRWHYWQARVSKRLTGDKPILRRFWTYGDAVQWGNGLIEERKKPGTEVFSLDAPYRPDDDRADVKIRTIARSIVSSEDSPIDQSAAPTTSFCSDASIGCCIMTSSATTKPKMTVKKSIVNAVM